MNHLGKISQSMLLAVLLGAPFPAVAADAVIHGKAACTVRNAAPVMRTMIPATLPPLAQIEGLSGKALVQIDLDSHGIVQDSATVVASTGYVLLDSAARHAAVMQTFTPEIRDCTAVAGTYLVIVEFE